MHVTGSRKGRKKSMNFELNLVPFIDVLSTCICFLLSLPYLSIWVPFMSARLSA